MKKVIALVLAVVMLTSVICCLGISASAEGGATMFWLTHYNDGNVEGAGTVFTETDEGGAWWHHVAFKPIEGVANAFEVAEIALGSDGEGTPLTVPEGGFVYAVNIGNNWPELCEGLTGTGTTWYDDPAHLAMPNYVTIGGTDAFAWAGSLTVGDQFVFTGLDLEGKVVPTTTPDKDWYEEGYVCTATVAPYAPAPLTIENLAAGKTYTHSELLDQNKNDPPVPSYPDEGDVTMTDGVKIPEDSSFYAELWAGFNQGSADYKELGYSWIRVDLGGIYTLDNASLFCGSAKMGSGIKGLKNVYVYVSKDGENFTEAGKVEDATDNAEADYNEINIALNNVSAKYVEFRFNGYSNWMFVSEVEVNGGIPGGPIAVKEVIIVDGKPGDTGWEDAEPFTKGQWQGHAEGTDPMPEIDIQYQVRTDDNNIYIATLIKNTQVDYVDETYQTGATNFRIWMQGDKAEARSFFDVTADGKGGWLTYLAKTATDTINAAGGNLGDDLYVEFSIAKETIECEESFGLMFTYSSPLVTDGEHTAYNAYHMTPCDEMPSGWSGNNSAYQEYVCEDIALGVKEPIIPPAPVDTYAEEIAAKVGEKDDDAKFDVGVKAEVGEDNKKVTVTISFENLKEELTGFVTKLN
ncbi:MAG: discoidin domain-containing protein, partial [Clostridiales bacterium]|nr:discoidin domain-containing protein [Candidatus Coliplasma caballi]